MKATISILISLLVCLTSCTGGGEKAEIQPQTFRVLTHNVWYGFTKVPARKQQWLDWMKAQQPDLVFLQELNEYTPSQLREDAAHWGHEHSVLLKEEGFPTGITSSFPIEDVKKVLEGYHHGMTRAKVNGLYIYNLHLHPGDWAFRSREADRLLADIATLPQDAPVLLAGDFNALSPLDSAFYAHGKLEPFFAGLDKQPGANNLDEGKLDYSVIGKLMEAGFVDALYHTKADGFELEGSFPGRLIDKEGEHGSRRRLDYVFVNKALLPHLIHADVISNDTTEALSDHLPVVADFEFGE